MKDVFPREPLSFIFLHKLYQQTNFKSHLNSVLLCKQGKMLSGFHISNLLVLPFPIKLKAFNYKIDWNILVFYDQWKTMSGMLSDLNMSCGKMSVFVSFQLFGFTLVIKLRNLDFENHWNTLMFFDKKDMVSDMNLSHRKMSNFVSFPLFGFT